jgi:hypothetical protein
LQADDLIKAEMYALMEWDVEGKEPPKQYSKQEMDMARQLIADESAKLAEEEQIEPKLDGQMWQVVANCSSELVRFQNRFTRFSNLNKRDQLEVLNEQFKASLHREMPI